MLNPITYTESTVSDFLRYQLTTYPFTDPSLHAQMRHLLRLDATRNSPLLRGPYISLSRAFRTGARLDALADEGVLHPWIASLAGHESAYGHQEQAFRAIAVGRHTLVATGTGSGKTECFLYPIISHCLRLREVEAPAGIAAVIVYPMNALAEDQLGRLRDLLAGTGISFGMYIGKTPEQAAQVSGVRLEAGSSRADYRAAVAEWGEKERGLAVHPPEERASREEMRAAGQQPRILLTNIKQMELLLTRQRDVELFDGARLDHLVFDEAHTFSGAGGAETACLIRRLRAYCGKGPEETVCIATSATIADPEQGIEAGRHFAARFFGVAGEGVALVGEDYERDDWAVERESPGALPGEPAQHLANVLEAVRDLEDDPGNADARCALAQVFETMTGRALDPAQWSDSLHEHLAANEVTYQLAELLVEPRPLDVLVDALEERLGRGVPEEEVLAWLTLGAAARKAGRPLLRPVVHAFVRGVGGAVVGFPEDGVGSRLWLSAADAHMDLGETKLALLPVLSCTTCGQHYFEQYLEDFEFTAKEPGGGALEGEERMWQPRTDGLGGQRAILLDQSIAGDPEGDDEQDLSLAKRAALVYLCRACGAVYERPGEACAHCGHAGQRVRLWVLQQKEDRPGKLTTCVACMSHGRSGVSGYREPARPVRATTVADVHVLAQNMLHHAERPRLLVFADNRQDAAFQAGWMRDHARRYRLRAMMHERLLEGPVSVGDLAAWLDRRLERDDGLSQALLPEVWQAARKEAAGGEHARERRYFLRIQVLREIATGVRQRIGLEPWGRLRVAYQGLTSDLPFVRRWAARLETTPQAMLGGIESLLDRARRGTALLDREGHIYSTWWREGDREIQRGYLPLVPGGPKALRLQREPQNRANILQWLSPQGLTTARHAAKRWGVPEGEINDFLTALWRLLTDELQLLVNVTLRGSHDSAITDTQGARQVDADRLLLHAHRGRHRCGTCQQVNVRPTPQDACMKWRCTGTVSWEEESVDDYDLKVLDEGYRLLRPREHSAQVRADEREFIERAFKGDSELVNTVVATPTLEMGVDIGALDAVLMRNVPPLPANYWQRAGRAGRRHRMAVSVTYARGASHDRAYFADPLKLLGGRIDPPRFNLRNDVMVRHHVHSTVLGWLHRSVRAADELPEHDRAEMAEALERAFPPQVAEYLFNDRGEVRAAPREMSLLRLVVSKHRAPLLAHVSEVFGQGWPEEDRAVVSAERLAGYIDQMADELEVVVRRLFRRLKWALDQLERLEEIRRRKGALDKEDAALNWRCLRLVKRLKGQLSGDRSAAEGVDATWTYGVLSVEGFLPGYGLDTGSIVAYHQAAFGAGRRGDWELRRSPSLALREYVPGNLVYAAGHKYLPRTYHLTLAGEDGRGPAHYEVDVAAEAVRELDGTTSGLSGGLGMQAITAIPICDVDVPHFSSISDDETYRFQMPVSIFGYEQKQHEGGTAWTWGKNLLTHRRGVRLRLVNVGAGSLVRAKGDLGYPVCMTCGASRSPLASQTERDAFAEMHRQRCGQPAARVGFYADVLADAVALVDCVNRTEAYSVMEALRRGAADILEMEVEDLQLLAVGTPGKEALDILLYDPMPGGSGLLDQMLERWDEVVTAALHVLYCPAQCGAACVDCLQRFRNAHLHRFLDRHLAGERLQACGAAIAKSHDIPSTLPRPAGPDDAKPVNAAEQRLLAMFERAGFHGARPQHEIEIGTHIKRTIPDFFFEDESGQTLGICVYLDGLSDVLHGKRQAHQTDRYIIDWLSNEGYAVRRIAATELDDPGTISQHFFWIGQRLVGVQRARQLRERPDEWYVGEAAPPPDDAQGGGATQAADHSAEAAAEGTANLAADGTAEC